MAFANEITEHKIIKINQGCVDDPIYLRWLNKQGGTSYWLFSRNNIYSTKTTSSTIYEKNITTLTSTQSNREIIEKRVERQIKVGAVVGDDDMDGLTGLFESPKVLMLVNPDTWSSEGAIWQSVIVVAGSMVILKTKTAFYEVDFDLILPLVYNQYE